MIVVDASLVVEVVLNTRAGWNARKRLAGVARPLYAPQLLDLEVTQVLRRGVLAGALSLSRAEEALSDLQAFRVKRCSHLPLLARVWQLRHNLTAYDAVYVALAEELGATLVTRDAKLASAAGHRARIDLV